MSELFEVKIYLTEEEIDNLRSAVEKPDDISQFESYTSKVRANVAAKVISSLLIATQKNSI